MLKIGNEYRRINSVQYITKDLQCKRYEICYNRTESTEFSERAYKVEFPEWNFKKFTVTRRGNGESLTEPFVIWFNVDNLPAVQFDEAYDGSFQRVTVKASYATCMKDVPIEEGAIVKEIRELYENYQPACDKCRVLNDRVELLTEEMEKLHRRVKKIEKRK